MRHSTETCAEPRTKHTSCDFDRDIFNTIYAVALLQLVDNWEAA